VGWISRGACPSSAPLQWWRGGVLVWPIGISQDIDFDNEQAHLEALDSDITLVKILCKDK
jgi:hypothetical protein